MNRQKISLLAAGLLLMSLSAQAQTKKTEPGGATAVPTPTSDRVAMADFKKLRAKGEVVVIDVRSADSYAAGHIPGALSIPEETITPALAEKLKRMGKPIAAYCS
jgi:3-mercaptopyruvate sulfurtransferase SseA